MLVNFKTLNIILKSILHFLLHRGWRLHPATYLFSLFLVQVLRKDKGRIFFLRDFMWLSLVSVTSPFWKSLYLSSSWKQEALLCHVRAVLTWVSALGIRRSCRGGSKSSRWPTPPPPVWPQPSSHMPGAAHHCVSWEDERSHLICLL